MISNFSEDVFDIILRYGIEDTDNEGQIIIYTGYRFDSNGEIVSCGDNLDEQTETETE
jgi:hypothetical protein